MRERENDAPTEMEIVGERQRQRQHTAWDGWLLGSLCVRYVIW